MNIAMIGPSGVGKGTHATQLISKYGMAHLVTGELLHQNLEQHTAVGFLASRYVSQGNLVPDEVVDAMVAEWLWRQDPEQGVLFDGFPRTIDQALFLDNVFRNFNRKLDGVVFLRIADEAVESRSIGRLICSSCQTPFHIAFKPPQKQGVCDQCGGSLAVREDDIQEIIRVRLRNFNRVLQPVLDYYSASDRLLTIDGDRSIELVGQELDEAVEEIKSRAKFESTSARSYDAESVRDQGKMIPSSEASHESFDLILVGGPGSGKGTQAKQLQSHLGLTHIASGDLFRENLKNETSLGKLAKSYMDRGELVPDDVTEAMVEERLGRSDVKKGFILDGFPRTLSQAYALTEILNAGKRRIDGVVYIRVSDAEIVRRISGRLICRDCQVPYHAEFKPPRSKGICDRCGGVLYQRDDDNAETVRARLKTFHSQTAPIIDYYRDAGLLIEIDGEGELDQVAMRTRAAADNLIKP